MASMDEYYPNPYVVSIPDEKELQNGVGTYKITNGQGSLRMSQRRNHKRIVSSVSNCVADEIAKRGDAVRLTWKDVSVYAEPDVGLFGRCCNKKAEKSYGKTILKNVSGVAEPGSVMAIMGSSGAGKSTLLNALTWRNRQNLIIEGEIKVNGRQLEEQITNVSAYVQQDDLFVGALTVREHLMFNAKLRMDSSVSESDKVRRVEEVMVQMGLMKCENTTIGTPGKTKTISGGEMKRLSFASELLTNPPLLFCDEPTSGLDSYLAKVLCECLQRIAKEGCTVLCTIHQPSSEVFELFDQLLLLALGKVIYFGPREGASEYYNNLGMPSPLNYNPADHFIMKISVIPGDEEGCRQKLAMLSEKYENSNNHKKLLDTFNERIENSYEIENNIIRSSPYKTNQMNQFVALLKRAAIQTYRDPLISRVRFGQTAIVALIIGLVYLRTPFGKPYYTTDVRNISGALFLVAINLTFAYVFGVINAFPTEIPLFRREHFNGMYSVSSYFLAKNIAELPMYFVLPLVYGVIVYFMIGLYPGAAEFFIFYAISVLLVNTSVSFGYLISCISPTVTVALAIGPPLVMPLLLFGGFFLSADSIPAYFIWLKYLSWFLYTNELLTVNQWQSVSSLECPDTTVNGTCALVTGADVIADFDFSASNFGRDIGLMFALLFGYRLLAYLALLLRMRDSTR